MAKAKPGSVPNKAIYSRVSYLYQAAAYMAAQQEQRKPDQSKTATNIEAMDDSGPESAAVGSSSEPQTPLFQPASRRLVADLRGVSRKVMLRISPTMKHSICKNCDTILVDGKTCTNEVENRSKGGRKPWADVLVRKCNVCGLAKRFPLAAKRQKRKHQRGVQHNLPVEAEPS